MFEAIIEQAQDTVTTGGQGILTRHPNNFDAKVFVDSLPGRPGVYRMLDGDGQILYVGKPRAALLKSRVGSYFPAEQCTAQSVQAFDSSGHPLWR